MPASGFIGAGLSRRLRRFVAVITSAIRRLGNEVVIVLSASDSPMSVTINGISYSQRVSDGAPLTANMIIAAATPLSRPTIAGAAQVGEVMTGTQGLWVYAGEFPDPPTFQWQRDGLAIPGATGLSYTTTIADSGANLTLAETFGGVSVASTPLAIAGIPQPTLIAQDFAFEGADVTPDPTTAPLELAVDVGPAQVGKKTVILSAIRITSEPDTLTHVGTGVAATQIGTPVTGEDQEIRVWEIDTSTLSGPQTFRVDFSSGVRRQASFTAFSMTNANTFMTSTDTGNGSTSASVDVPEAGALLTAAFNIWTGSPIAWTGATEQYDQPINEDVYFSSAASEFALAAETGRTVTAANSSNSFQLLMLVSVGA